jgi:hypothetical protein
LEEMRRKMKPPTALDTVLIGGCRAIFHMPRGQIRAAMPSPTRFRPECGGTPVAFARCMNHRTRFNRRVAQWLGLAAGAAAGAYAAFAALAWRRYGKLRRADSRDSDALLDRFMPEYEIVERHHVRVRAPAAVTFDAASEMDLNRSPVVRGIFRAREILLGATPDRQPRPRGLLAAARSFGWGVLAEVPGREVVVGAVTKPWEADVRFRALAPDEFAAFDEPGYVKIAWTIRADAVGDAESVFRTETRAIATDAVARSRFRRYWSLLSPGIIVIRWAMLGPVKQEAERRAS